MNKQQLIQYLDKGMTNREIAKIVGKGKSTVSYWVRQWGLQEHLKYKKPVYKDKHFFSKINTKEKAYILGFILGDGYLTDEILEVSIALDDKAVLDFIQECLGGNIRTSKVLNKKKKRYPSAHMNIGQPTMLKDLKKLFGGYEKEDRNLPIISPNLNRYLLQGFFDAEGCITWGRRKDRNRLWHKFSFTSQLSMLEGVQNILLDYGIATKIRPKSNGDKCFVMENAARDTVVKFLDIIYPDDKFIVLQRKYKKAHALRLELGEFGEA